MAEWKSLLDEAKLQASEQFSAAWKLHVDRVSEALESGWRENIARVVEQRFEALKSELTAANEEWLAGELEERVAARLNDEWKAQIEQHVEARINAEFEERVGHQVEEQLALRLEGEVEAKLEEETTRRLAQVLPARVEEAVAAQIEQRLEAAVSDRVVAILPERVDEVLTLRLAEELPGRIAAEKAQWDAEFVPLAEQAKQQAVEAVREQAREQARRETRQQMGQELGQALRVLRAANDGGEWKEAVLNAVAPFGALTALFLVTKDRFTLEGVRGVGELETGFDLEFHEAAAFLNAKESKDLVVALRGDSEVSPYVMSLRPEAGAEGGVPGKCYVFPVMVQGEVAALLYVEPREAGGEASRENEGEPVLEIGTVEALATAAGLSLHALRASRAAQASSLVNIASAMNGEDGGTNAFGDLRLEAVGVGAGGVGSGGAGVAGAAGAMAVAALPERSFNWDELSQEDRELHMRAQRFARTQVAEMRLYKDDAVKSGRRDANIYLRLREEIDGARERYQAQFLDGQVHMRDYLHAELVETLAIDNPQLMGPDYPGPLA